MDAASGTITAAFASDAKLRKRIFDAINETPQHAALFTDIASYHLTNKSPDRTEDVGHDEVHPSKKRKLESNGSNGASAGDIPRQVILEARDLSFSLPQRKKFHLNLVQYGQHFDDASTRFSLCARNPATNQVEFEYSIRDFAYALRVPVPEKAQKQYNFCLMPPTAAAGAEAGPIPAGEGVIWTVNHGPLKSSHITSAELKQAVGEDDILEKALDVVLQRNGNKLRFPSDVEFASAVPEAHRKKEKAYHVKAHRGSKDGYLFFLENGIFFGFKKPLAFFPFHEIESVSYTNVLRNTFNLVITIRTSDNAEPQEIEFSMIDQVDFAGIDTYIKTHHLQDASLADARRAKQYKVNGNKTAEIDDDPDDGRTELEKAEAELQDEEDEQEEDYDPEADDDDDSDDSAYDSDAEVEYTAGKNRNLVKEELGSEAEDVSDSEADDQNGDDIGDDGEEDDENEEEAEEEADNTLSAPDPMDQDISAPAPAHKSTASAPAPAASKIPHHPAYPSDAPAIDDEDQL